MGHSAVANQAKSVPRSNVLLTVKLQSRDVRSTEADIYKVTVGFKSKLVPGLDFQPFSLLLLLLLLLIGKG